MKATEKLMIAIAILVFDLITPFLPITVILGFVIVLVKPLWFKEFVDELYSEIK